MNFIKQLTWLQWIFLGAVLLTAAMSAGLAFGYVSGSQDREENLKLAIASDIQIQYDLGLQDFEAGNYALARQRFDYVLQQNPNFPGVVDKLAETLLRLSEPVVQITDVVLPTPTPSPTPDTRQADELYLQIEQHFSNQEWKALVDAIVALRDIDPLYRAVEVDRMLFLGLRFSGIEKILDDGNLEGGLYDLARVERFGPIDSQARIYQEWARLYQIGVSFWGVFPEKSVYYFSQLASAAPYLRDFSGIFAKDRYRMALLQYGDYLTQTGEWCLAIEQYNLAQTLVEDQGLQPTMIYAEDQCLHGESPTATTPEIEVIGTPTLTLIPTLTGTLDPNLTPTSEVTTTPTPIESTSEPSPSATESIETPIATPTVGETTETPAPTSTPEAAP